MSLNVSIKLHHNFIINFNYKSKCIGKNVFKLHSIIKTKVTFNIMLVLLHINTDHVFWSIFMDPLYDFLLKLCLCCFACVPSVNLLIFLCLDCTFSLVFC